MLCRYRLFLAPTNVRLLRWLYRLPGAIGRWLSPGATGRSLPAGLREVQEAERQEQTPEER